MHFTSLLLAACIALRALAVPLPVSETNHLELDDEVGHHRTPGLPSWDHLSPLPHANTPVIDELSAAQHWDDSSRHASLLVDHSTEMVPRSTPNKPMSSTTSKKNRKPKPELAGGTVRQPKKPAPKATSSTEGETKKPDHKSRRPVPSVEELKKHLHVEPDKSLFYCGSSKPFIGLARRRAVKMGEKILEMAWDKEWTEHKYVSKLFGATGVTPFWDNASQAFAELSSGTVHVLLEDNIGLDDFNPTTVWARVEWPALQANPHVTKVVKVTKAGAQKTLLDRTHSSPP